ncbi:MAG TPA: hypothetical protein VMZ30_11650 [Pyrinomonadaceae bacterium]|nr:hypothetical protein [Pyrinomonadaceae bacterium]
MSIEETPPSKWRRITYLLPLIVPGLVFVTFFVFYSQFLFCSPNDPCTPLTAAEILSGTSNLDQTRVATYVARASWALISGVHLLACLAAIVTAGLVIYQALPEPEPEYPKNLKWLLILIVVAAAADISLLVAIWVSTDVSSPAQTLLRTTVGQMVPSINRYNRLADALSLTGTLSLAVAACATLWQRDAAEENETELVKRVNLLRPVLYVSAATLAIAVLKLSATLGWAASYLSPDSEIGKSVVILVRGIVASMGTFYTLLVAGVYVPAALLLRARIRKLAKSQKPDDPDGWLASHGLTLSFPQYLPRVIALLGPLLAGPLAELLSKAALAFTG